MTYLHVSVDSYGNPAQTFIANYNIECESDIEDKDPLTGNILKIECIVQSMDPLLKIHQKREPGKLK